MKVPQVFIDRAAVKLKAEAVAGHLSDDQRGDLLLYTAYHKRIRQVPFNVALGATHAFTNGSQVARVSYSTTLESAMVMEEVCEKLWPVDEMASREWLLKAV